MSELGTGTVMQVPARTIASPAHLSDAARAYLRPLPTAPYPALDDKDGWRTYVAAVDAALAPMLGWITASVKADVAVRNANGARVFDITPEGIAAEDRGVVLDIHGGALILCGGDLCCAISTGLAALLKKRVWAVDYRMPPDHPYPAALDDCFAAYRTLLSEREPEEIIISGTSAGGNLAAALLLRARDAGLPMPAGLVLRTPEVDLTESGDSFQTHDGIDPGLRSLMPVNLLYANGHDLAHPYLSPLFANLGDFPPTILTTGTRDLYLSNTVRMHRKLRAANVPAELHVTEAGPHTGFPGAPEGDEIDREVQRFVTTALETHRRTQG
jgi:acetyl esterase/lipase